MTFLARVGWVTLEPRSHLLLGARGDGVHVVAWQLFRRKSPARPYPTRAMTVAALIAIASAGFVAPGSLSISTACSRSVRALTPMASGGDLAAVGHEDAVEISLTGAQRFLLPTNRTT